jgi:hypothetical protein
MPLLDLSQVTQTLLDTIRLSVTASPAWNPANTLNVVPLPPDSLTGDNTLGFYLYHIGEESQNRNAYVPGVSDVPVRYIPLDLRLYYLLTAHSSLDNGTGTLREQLMMGLAMKGLHDYPQIMDDTVVAGIQPLPLSLRGNDNCFRITLMNTPVSNAVDYWTAGSSPLRLSAYYEVAVVRLEPEEPQVRPGRVLHYNIFVLSGDHPRVDTTASIITFTIPGESESRSLELRPAQVTYNAPFAVHGSAFIGDEIRLLLRHSSWDEPVAADGSWNLTAGATTISAIARQSASGNDVIPGIYAASVQISRTQTTPTGSQTFTSTSNETPFVITPQVTSISIPDAQGNFTVTGAIFQHPEIAADEIRFFIGNTRLQPGTAGSLQPGEFAVTSSTTIDVRLPSGLNSGEAVTVRLIINGAETAPLWVVAP